MIVYQERRTPFCEIDCPQCVPGISRHRCKSLTAHQYAGNFSLPSSSRGRGIEDPGKGGSYCGGDTRSSADRRRLTVPICLLSFFVHKKLAAPPAGVGGGLAHSRLMGDFGMSIFVGGSRDGVRSTMDREARVCSMGRCGLSPMPGVTTALEGLLGKYPSVSAAGVDAPNEVQEALFGFDIGVGSAQNGLPFDFVSMRNGSSCTDVVASDDIAFPLPLRKRLVSFLGGSVSVSDSCPSTSVSESSESPASPPSASGRVVGCRSITGWCQSDCSEHSPLLFEPFSNPLLTSFPFLCPYFGPPLLAAS